MGSPAAMEDEASAAFGATPEMEGFLCDRLLDAEQPIAERFRALFSLRNLRGDAPRRALLQAARDSSNLLAHEAAFALGQMQDAEAIPALEAVLKDLSLHPIVRHEAAEALGAIGLEKSISLLEESLSADPAVEVKETCELALRRIEEQKNTSGAESATVSPFLSVDPALPAKQGLSVEQLRDLLLNEQESMYQRYAALFALRNDSGNAAVSAIIAALGVKSALLRHEGCLHQNKVEKKATYQDRFGDMMYFMRLLKTSECMFLDQLMIVSSVKIDVAYVLGQLQNKAAADALSTVLKNVDEHPMVRHEAAEALGSIADQESIALLEEFAKDPEPIVSQSCEVALSMLEFERSGKSFEFLFLQTPQVQQES